MSHHSSDKSLTDILEAKQELIEELRKRPAQEEMTKQLESELGPTKTFPDGKIVPHDEGGLMFGVTVFNGRVIFDFGKPIRSIGFTREGALELAELIKRRAEQCPAILFPKSVQK
jgi:hypothetical protein